MDPTTIALLIGRMAVQAIPGGDLILAASELIKNLANAKQEYQDTPKDMASPTEQRREKLLGTLSELQTQIVTN